MAKESMKVNLGLLSVTTSYTNSKTLFGAGPPTETRQDQTIALDLSGLRNQGNDSFRFLGFVAIRSLCE